MAGGLYPIFAVQRFGEGAGTEEYLYGGGTCSSAATPKVTLNVTVE